MAYPTMQRRKLEPFLVVDAGVVFFQLPQAEKFAGVVVLERPQEPRQRRRRERNSDTGQGARGQREATYCFTPIDASSECRPK